EQTAGDRTGLGGGGVLGAADQDTDVLLGLQDLHGAVLVAGRDDDLGEDVGDLAGHLDGDRAVGGDHPTERGDRVAGVGEAVGLGHVGGGGDAAGVGVLDDGDGRAV